jgi:hypothetical protein
MPRMVAPAPEKMQEREMSVSIMGGGVHKMGGSASKMGGGASMQVMKLMKVGGPASILLPESTKEENKEEKSTTPLLSDNDARCYAARFSDLKGAAPLTHYATVGVA